MSPSHNINGLLVSGLLLMTGVFVAEVYTHILGTVAYIAITGYTLWRSTQRSEMVVATAAATILLVTGYFFAVDSDNLGGRNTFIANRTMAIIVVWFSYYFTVRYKKTEATEVRQRKQLDALFNTATEGILIVNESGQIVMVNPHALIMFGYEKQELQVAGIEKLLPARFAKKHEGLRTDFFVRPANRPMGSGLDLYGMRKDGTEFPVEISLSHFVTEEGRFVVAFVVDITERKKWINEIRQLNDELEKRVELRTKELMAAKEKAEEANETLQREIAERKRMELRLRNSQELYKAMARNFPEGWIGVLDADLRCVFADGKGLASHGVNTGQAIGRKFGEIVGYEKAHELLQESLKGKGVTFEMDCNGRNCEVNAVPFSNGHSDNEILVVVHDITSLKKTEHELMRSLEKERELGELKSRFVTLASHEFRTPLTTILSSSFLLESYTGEKYEKEKSTHIGRIKRAVKILTEILNDFLSLGKLEEGVIRPNIDSIHFPEFLAEVSKEVEGLKRDQQQLSMLHSGDADIHSDRQLLRNIIYNLVSNAFKYSKNDGGVVVECIVKNNVLSIRVSDYGLGIPEEEQKHIFRRFYRARNVTNIQGTGLGLNIVKKYVDLLKGSIEFTSKPGQGTTFTVSVPVTMVETINDST